MCEQQNTKVVPYYAINTQLYVVITVECTALHSAVQYTCANQCCVASRVRKSYCKPRYAETKALLHTTHGFSTRWVYSCIYQFHRRCDAGQQGHLPLTGGRVGSDHCKSAYDRVCCSACHRVLIAFCCNRTWPRAVSNTGLRGALLRDGSDERRRGQQRAECADLCEP